MDNQNTSNSKDTIPPKEENSVLIPKIEVSDMAPVAVVKETTESVLKDFSKKPTSEAPKAPKKNKKIIKILLGVLGVFLFFIIYNVISGLIIYQKANKLIDSGKVLAQAATSQDLVKMKSELGNTNIALKEFKGAYGLVAWEKFLPFVGPYIGDGSHILKAGEAGLSVGETVLTVIEPYADLLGFSNGTTSVLGVDSSEQTTQDRINFIVNAIPDLLPQIDAISEKMKIVQSEISEIDTDKYPAEFRGIAVRSKLKSAQDLVSEASTFLVNGKPFLESAQYLLGMDSPRTYLVLFQNDKEIRPTGGFMTAYSIMKVDKATFDPTISSDIYTLDAKYTPTIQAPDPIINYIKGPYVLSQKWRLRDMNWSPDFATSMETVIPAITKAGITNIDGIIAVDTHLLVNLLNVIGPIGVPGFGNFSTEISPKCNCPQVIYELESFADVEGPIIWDPLTGKIIQRPPNSDNRKEIIGPLMNSIMANALAQPKEKIPALMQAGFTSLLEKHVLFYLMDEKVQTAVSDFGLGGKIDQTYENDYLHISDANLGGRKSNLYAYSEVQQDIDVSGNGTVTKTVTITYKNPEKQDGWLNSVLPTWVRVYVPKGSELIASEGLDKTQDPYEDLGKTVYAGYFQLRPEGVSKVTLKYKLPFKVSKQYKLLIQKQPGTDGFLYTVNLGKHTEEFFLKQDKELKISI